MGVCDVVLKWFQNYLSDRFLRVMSGAIFSDWGSVSGGIPHLVHFCFWFMSMICLFR